MFSQQSILGICKQWGVPPAPAREQQPVHSAIPILILSGRFDPRTPPSYAEETAKTLPNSHLYTFPALSHAVTQDPCAITLAAAFVENPSTPPTNPCLTAQPAPAWDIGP